MEKELLKYLDDEEFERYAFEEIRGAVIALLLKKEREEEEDAANE